MFSVPLSWRFKNGGRDQPPLNRIFTVSVEARQLCFPHNFPHSPLTVQSIFRSAMAIQTEWNRDPLKVLLDVVRLGRPGSAADGARKRLNPL